ncbi:hypothetical protein QTH97_30100 [Variovorax sp. J22R24]|uniref:hypothetical protein n=1 Tax=Variovorax gracilis TaxID=3053502 RepID=UPI0025763033|nr:hypothetical protein [Variovorax sp. J22R24]MDM0109225.1 hypothetical protein [Variovorax sp. J22R24]
MTLDELCAEARGLTPRAARMASVMLPMAGPLSTAWNTAVADALELAACGGEPLAPSEVNDVLAAALHPVGRAGWLLQNVEFVLAHRLVVNAHLAGEKWKSIVMTLLEHDGDRSHH